MSNRRRGLIATQNSGGLPAEYQQVEWLRSDGNAYIATNFTGNSNTNWYAKGTKLYEHRGDKYLFGVADGVHAEIYQAIRFYGMCGTDSRWGGSPSGTSDWYNKPFEITMTPTLCTINGLSSAPTSSVTVPYTRPIFVFARNHLGTPSNIANVYELTTIVATENETKTLELIACYRKSDNEIGMYDTVGKQFYANSGSGTFTKGPDIA